MNAKRRSPPTRVFAYDTRCYLQYAGIQLSRMGPNLQKDIDKLEKTQRQAARFITGDYISRDQGCVTRMFKDLAIPLLQAQFILATGQKESQQTGIFLNGGRGAGASFAMSCDYLTPIRNKRQIRSKLEKVSMGHGCPRLLFLFQLQLNIGYTISEQDTIYILQTQFIATLLSSLKTTKFKLRKSYKN